MSRSPVSRRVFLGGLSLPLALAVPSRGEAIASNPEKVDAMAAELLQFYKELGLEDKVGIRGLSDEEAKQQIILAQTSCRYSTDGGYHTYSAGVSDDTGAPYCDT